MKRVALLALGGLALGLPSTSLAQTDPLRFEPANFTLVHVTVDGEPMEVRRYRMVYVAKPTEIDITAVPRGPAGAPAGPAPAMAPGAATSNATAPPNGIGPASAASDPHAYQTMYVYVPAASYGDAAKAIILQVNNGGWMASPARDILRDGAALSSTSNTDNTGAALKAGYVVVAAGTRSRGIKDTAGRWAGKAPAVIVDAKAAVRYLRHNDAAMPGSAERIVITGTSGGGALSVAVSASGNSPDYFPELAAVGAAGVDARGRSTIRDDVFATIAYCPINDLGHSDIAYEWQYNAARSAANTANGRFDPAYQAASSALAAQYPAFLASLGLTRADGSRLTADNLPATITELLKASIEGALARGEKVPQFGEDFEIPRRGPPGAAPSGPPNRLRNDWLTLENGHVKSIDYAAYIRFVAANQTLKGVPAFDATASSGNGGVLGENTLFGPAKLEYSNFTRYAWDHNERAGDGSGRDDTGLDWAGYLRTPAGADLARQVKMSSPLPYLNSPAASAPYWYVRHGTLDRDTAFATQVTLATAIRNDPSVKDLNFKLAWMQGHAGNYDVQEAYAWLAEALAKAGPARRP